jgi:transcriptional regulator with PAS, ATPase and Fis domain
MNYEMELKKIMDLDSRTITDYEDYRMFRIGVDHNRLNSESKLLSALHMALKMLVESRETNKEEVKYDTISVKDLNLEDHYDDMRSGKKIAYKARITKEKVLRALKDNNGNRALAAKELGCSEKTIYNRLKG